MHRQKFPGLVPGLCLLLALAAPLQGANWSRTFGGSGGEDLWKARELADGTLVVAGATDDSFGGFGTWLVTLDSGGLVLGEDWVTNPEISFPTPSDAVALASDGGAFLTGRNIREFFTMHHAWVTRWNPDGTLGWTRTFFTPPINDAFGRWMLQDAVATGDGGVFAAGVFSEIDTPPLFAWVVKLDDAGNMEWQDLYGGGPQEVHAVAQTEDGGYVVAGRALDNAWVMRLDTSGVLDWSKTYGASAPEAATGITELSDGGYGLSGWTDSWTASGHAGWMLRIDVNGDMVWQRVLGEAEWSDLQDVQEMADGGLLFTGRLGEPGFPTNDLWLVKTDDQGTTQWQRAYEGTRGDWGAVSLPLQNGEWLIGATWGWGFAEEDFWLLRVNAEGRIPGCELLREPAVSSRGPRIDVADLPLTPVTPDNDTYTDTFEANPSQSRDALQCEATGCAPLLCDEIRGDTDPLCDGDESGWNLVFTGGEGTVTVTWDFDGDTQPDATGNPVTASLDETVETVSATATDSCGAPQTCTLSLPVDVLSSAPPEEVSRVQAGAPPLRVRKLPDEIVVEGIPEATAYNLYADTLGSWYFPVPALGTRCRIDRWTDNGDGTLTLDPSPELPTGIWLVVTAATRCAEGPAGTDSAGTERSTVGDWTACGPSGFSDGR